MLSDGPLDASTLVLDEASKLQLKDGDAARKTPWREIVRDENNIIKCKKNAFGSKGYKLNFDKSTLSMHINRIMKTNIVS